MKNWYKSGPCKCALVVLEMLLTVVTVVSAVWVLSFPASNLETLLKSDIGKAYEDTQIFDEALYSAAASIIPAEHWGAALHLEKKDTLVDVKAFFEGNEITGKNDSGFAYRLDDLIAWWEHGYDYNYSGMAGDESSEITVHTRQSVAVCRAEDGTYAYYYNDEFYDRLLSGEFQPQLKQELEERGADTIEELVDSYAEFDEFPAGKILDKEGNTLYEEMWRYDGLLIDERYKPEGAESILDLANRVPEWNGKLSEAEEELLSVLQSVGQAQSQIAQGQQLWSEGNTNVSYMLVEKDEKRVYSNREEFKDFANWEDHVKQLKEAGRYVLITPKLADFESDYDTSAVLWRDLVNDSRADEGDYVYLFAVDTSYPVQDTFYAVSKSFEMYGSSVKAAFGIGVTGLALMIVVFVWLTIIAGRKGDGTEEVCLNSVDKVRTEIFLGVAGVLFVIPSLVFVRSMAYVGRNVYNYRDELQTVSMPDVTEMVLIGGIAAVCCATGLLLWLGIVRRFKAKTLWKNSLLYWIGGKVVRVGRRMWKNITGLISQIGLLWKTALIVAAYILFQMLVVYQVSYRFSGDFWAFLLVVLDVAVFLFVMWDVIGRHRIQEGVKAIAEGQVDYQIQTDHMRAEQKKLVEGIHSIGDGLEHAVQESLKNERMKTDLITNVSHDIKTPLTSIINYVELLKRENFEDPKIQSYLKVLEEKSQRLKTLTEDVVEASKVSSGNINLEKMNLNLVELINQTSAEFEEKFAAKELDLRLTMPEEPMIVYADGRRMWRVLSNIFNNIAKYAMTNSRVYADLKDCGNTVQFQLKNISEQPLNIQADELTERFVRGDVSRNTEGSGLGLSIAKSLTEIQGGTFDIFVDGDLFKVVITFPKVKTVS